VRYSDLIVTKGFTQRFVKSTINPENNDNFELKEAPIQRLNSFDSDQDVRDASQTFSRLLEIQDGDKNL